MVKHLALMTVGIAFVAFGTVYPFLPGEYDGLATTWSVMAQLFGMAGLLLVPLGAAWLAYEWKRSRNDAAARLGRDMGYRFALASVGVSTVVALVVAFGPIVTSVSPSLALAVVVLWASWARHLVARLRGARHAATRTFHPAPVYLVALPLAAFAARIALVGPASEFSRGRVIENSARLIGDIERYRDAHGHYPRSLQSLHEDYKPSIIGVERYHYEPSGDAYNLYFEQLAVALDAKEIVMYNKLDEHQFTSHDADLLQYAGPELDRMRGYVSVHDASQPHWKCFLFD